MLVVAAIIEGNITRHTGMGQTLRGVFILLNFSLILMYFGWYPFYKNKRGFKKNLDIKVSNENTNSDIDLNSVYSFEDTFKHIFIWFGKFSTSFVREIVFSSLIVIAFIIYVAGSNAYEKFGMQITSLNTFEILKTMFHSNAVPLLSFCYALVFALVSYWVSISFQQSAFCHQPTREKTTNKLSTVNYQLSTNFVFSIILYYCVVEFLASGNSLLFIIALMYVINIVQNGYCLCVSCTLNENTKALNYFLGNYSKDILLIFTGFFKNRSGRLPLYLFFLLIAFLAFLSSFTGIASEYLKFVSWNLSFLNETNREMVSTYILLGINLCIFFTLFILMNIGGALTGFIDLEAKEGRGIFEKVNAIKPLCSTMGIIRES